MNWKRSKTETSQANAETAGSDIVVRKRRRRLTPKMSVWLAVIVVLLIALAASIGLFGGNDNPISLPDEQSTKPEAAQEEQGFTLSDADITVDNVQKVIDELERPESYTISIDNTVYWEQDWNSCQVNQYVLDDLFLTEYMNTTQEPYRYELIQGDTYYSWRVGKKKYHTGKTGSLTTDQAAMIPTYETIVDLDKKSITDAGLREIDGVPCVYCVVEDEDSGYTITYSVSTVSGLLVQAQYTRKGELVRSVDVTNVDTNAPDSSKFVLPDGTSLVADYSTLTGSTVTTADDITSSAEDGTVSAAEDGTTADTVGTTSAESDAVSIIQ
ncbi:MAG: hypothetical protein ACI4PM_04045 [Butyricicoccus sp.]